MFSCPIRWSRLGISLALSLLLGVTGSSAQELSEPTKFVDAVLSRHPALKKADERVRSAEFSLRASGLQPNPNLTLAVTAGDAGESSNALTQNFEISGQPKLRGRMADAMLRATKLRREAIQRQVALTAYRSWLSVWKGHRLLELAVLRERLATEMMRVARRRFEVGEISENESLRVELAAAQAKTNSIQSQADFEGALRGALLLLAAESAASLPEVNPPDPIALLPDLTLETLLSSVAEHPNMAAQEAEIESLAYGAKLIGKERAPSLGLSVYRSRLLRTNTVEQGAQLSLSWPIFDWGSISHRRDQKKAAVLAERAALEETLLEVRQDIVNHWTQLEAFKEKRQVLTEQAQRYEELARESRVAYDVGLLSLTDVLQTERSYRQAGVQLLEATASILELELSILEKTALPLPQEFLKEDL